MMGKAALLWCASVFAAAATLENEPREDFWITDGIVHDVALVDDALFVAGLFRYVGPITGSAALTDLNGDLAPGFPAVEGSVFAVAGDRNGGWFVGGEFSSIGGVARANLAHVLPNGMVNPVNISASGPVYALVRTGDTVYAGGDFGAIGNQGRANLAAFNADTGQLLGWNPACDGIVRALASDGDTVFIGGEFAGINGQLRRNLAAVDAVSGALRPWDPRILRTFGTPVVNAVIVTSGTLYVGGSFNRIEWAEGAPTPILQSVTRENLAAFDVGMDAPRSWAPRADGPVYALLRAGTRVYIGGGFFTINSEVQDGIGAVGAISGEVVRWVDGGVLGTVRTLTMRSSNLYAGGDILEVGVQTSAANIIRMPLGSEGLPVQAFGGTSGRVHALAFQGSQLFVGGEFQSAGGKMRRSLAALDPETGQDLGYDIDANGGVFALAVRGGTVYVAGGFNSIGGVNRGRLAALQADPANPLLPWNGDASFTVRGISVQGNRVFIGGDFQQVRGQPRMRLAALDADTASLLPWNPSANGRVTAVEATPLAVYIGGEFTSVSGQSRLLAAALDPTTGLVLPWDPFVQGESVRSLVLDGERVFIGGEFQGVGSVLRANIAAVNRVSGALLDWNPGADDAVDSVTTRNGTVYAAGDFTQVAGQPRAGLAALHSTGQGNLLLPWNADGDSAGRVIRDFDDFLFVGLEGGRGLDANRGMLRFDFQTGPPPNPFDINQDGAVNALDVQLVINAALGIAITPFSADVNGDGSINAVDVQLVINAALGIS